MSHSDVNAVVVPTEEFLVDGELRELVSSRGPTKVLDAGGGARVQIDPGPQAHITGIDVSEDELAKNTRLDERIVGDLQTADLPAAAYDLVVCFDVLEHLARPEAALERMARATAPGGLLIVKCPNARSVKGLVTKVTPHWFHKWMYKRVMPFVQHEPFPTYMRLVVSPAGIVEWARAHRFGVAGVYVWEGYVQRRVRQRLWVTGWRWRAVCSLVSTVSLRGVAADRTDFLVVLEAPGGAERA